MSTRIVFSFALGIILSGCATNLTYFKTHDLTKYSKNEICLVQGGNIQTQQGTVEIRFEDVDGVKFLPKLQAMRGEGLWRIQVKPGNHKIYTEIRFNGKSIRANLVRDFEAGKKYTFSPDFDSDKAMKVGWNVSDIADEEFKQQ